MLYNCILTINMKTETQETIYFNGLDCPKEYVLALKDTMNVISGKWKLAIIGTLLGNVKRFSEMQRMISDITPKMLSKELKELEINGVVERRVIPSTPVVVEYYLTPSGKKLKGLINQLVEWGIHHRVETMG